MAFIWPRDQRINPDRSRVELPGSVRVNASCIVSRFTQLKSHGSAMTAPAFTVLETTNTIAHCRGWADHLSQGDGPPSPSVRQADEQLRTDGWFGEARPGGDIGVASQGVHKLRSLAYMSIVAQFGHTWADTFTCGWYSPCQ